MNRIGRRTILSMLLIAALAVIWGISAEIPNEVAVRCKDSSDCLTPRTGQSRPDSESDYERCLPKM